MGLNRITVPSNSPEMAKQQGAAAQSRISKVFPWYYQFLFMILEPGIILVAMPMILLDPANHFLSLAPTTSSGPFYKSNPAHSICSIESAWNTPQLRALWYVFTASFIFSGIVEPLLLYTARYKLRDARDAEEVVKAVLISMLTFDVLHITATTAVGGFESAIPWGVESELYAMINFWGANTLGRLESALVVRCWKACHPLREG
ncbi:hypothetical protein NLU13_7838 [Sarocladium strictum]|uniref:Uncharacterized protein n=1 Tax=Sarocladium strictum TaxID=5046 RepID=A0AA39GFX0_SARSR|nr:hypothetical protein NLU13_7838 [Sarocladium strictum]